MVLDIVVNAHILTFLFVIIVVLLFANCFNYLVG